MKKLNKYFRTVFVLLCMCSSANAQAPVITIDSIINVSCFGVSNGAIYISVSGGTPPYTYLWSTSDTTQDLTNVPAGTYTVVVYDNAAADTLAVMSVTQPSQLNISISTTTNVSCNGYADGFLCATVTGGTAPYAYLWSIGATTQCIASLVAGTYSVTVYDSNNCTATISATVTEPPPLIIDSTTSVYATCGNNNGSACIYASGGTPPYAYLWAGFQTTQCVTGLTAGVYTVTLTDANGCTISTQVIINNTSGPTIIIDSIQNVSCFGGNDGAIFITVSGGTAPYLFAWSNSTITEDQMNLSAGTYTVTVTDANNCIAITSATVTEPNQIQIFFTGSPYICSGDSTTITANVSGGTPPYNYMWSNGSLGSLITNIPGTYTLTVTDINACTVQNSINLHCDDVWPGDANYDGISNNTDLLSIGIGYGSTGPVRPGATNNWIAQAAPQWAQNLISGINYKHIDCNGDGFINDADTVAISLNYGMTHPLRLMPNPAGLLDPYLYFNITVDTAGTSQQIDVQLMFGTSAVPADSIYGLAFTVNYDTALVKADSVNISFSPSWIGTIGTDMLTIQHNDPLNGQLHVGMTRTDQNNISGFGEIARVTVVTVDNVSGRLLNNPIIDTLTFSFSDVLVIDKNENPKIINIGNDSLIVQDSTTAIHEILFSEKVKIHPNPVNDNLFVEIPFGYSIHSISITNIIGEKMEIKSAVRNNSVGIINLQNFTNGIYFIKIKTDKGSVVKKFSIIK